MKKLILSLLVTSFTVIGCGPKKQDAQTAVKDADAKVEVLGDLVTSLNYHGVYLIMDDDIYPYDNSTYPTKIPNSIKASEVGEIEADLKKSISLAGAILATANRKDVRATQKIKDQCRSVLSRGKLYLAELKTYKEKKSLEDKAINTAGEKELKAAFQEIANELAKKKELQDRLDAIAKLEEDKGVNPLSNPGLEVTKEIAKSLENKQMKPAVIDNPEIKTQSEQLKQELAN